MSATTEVVVWTVDGHKHTIASAERVDERDGFLRIQYVTSTPNGERRNLIVFNLRHVIWFDR